MPYFNEALDQNGNIRPHYSTVFEHWNSLPLQKRKELRTRSKQLFSGDYYQDPLPRILTQEEFYFLSRGVEQRARAILAFLQDYCKKGNHWRRVMPASTLHSIILRHHEKNTLDQVGPDRLAFPYGPDIIRDRMGQWRIVEDSAGIIGGMGDLMHGHRVLYRLMPNLRNAFGNSTKVNDPMEFFGNLAKYFSKRAAENDGIPLLYLRPYGDESDQETRRLSEAFRKFGIESTTASNHLKKIQIREGKGIYLRTAKSTERVGALLFHAGPEQLDGRTVLLDLRAVRESRNKRYIKDFIRSFSLALDAPSLKDALMKRHVWTNFSPGIQFVNDKTFGLFIDKMIRILLKETPILESIPAGTLAIFSGKGYWKADTNAIAKLRRNRDRFVIKRVDMDGGSGVWIGQKESRTSWEKIIEKIRNEPEKFIYQEFEHLSVLEDRIVDLRLHAHVDSEKIIVSNTPWGRANWIHGNGKVNIGSKGFSSPVFVMKKCFI